MQHNVVYFLFNMIMSYENKSGRQKIEHIDVAK